MRMVYYPMIPLQSCSHHWFDLTLFALVWVGNHLLVHLPKYMVDQGNLAS